MVDADDGIPVAAEFGIGEELDDVAGGGQRGDVDGERNGLGRREVLGTHDRPIRTGAESQRPGHVGRQHRAEWLRGQNRTRGSSTSAAARPAGPRVTTRALRQITARRLARTLDVGLTSAKVKNTFTGPGAGAGAPRPRPPRGASP